FPSNRLLLQRLGSLAGALARACVGLGTLTAQRQAAAMAEAAVATDVHQTLDVHRGFATQIALDGEGVHLVTHLLELGVAEILDLLAVCDATGVADQTGAGAPDTEDRGQADFGVLVRRNVDACNTGHL